MRRQTWRPGPLNRLLAALAMLAAFTTVASPSQDPAVVEDLRHALIIQGIACDDVASVERRGNEDYEIACSGGGRYRLNVTNDGVLIIFTIVAGIANAGIKGIETVIRLPGLILGYSHESPEHLSEVARQVYSIVVLAGHACSEVTGLERRAVDDHVLSCRQGDVYRVHNAADGLVLVETQ